MNSWYPTSNSHPALPDNLSVFLCNVHFFILIEDYFILFFFSFYTSPHQDNLILYFIEQIRSHQSGASMSSHIQHLLTYEGCGNILLPILSFFLRWLSISPLSKGLFTCVLHHNSPIFSRALYSQLSLFSPTSSTSFFSPNCLHYLINMMSLMYKMK